MKILAFNPERCDGSRECEVTCAQTWFKVSDRSKSRIRIRADETLSAEYCIQCGECIHVCPTEAIIQDKRGVVRVKSNLCIGCLSCVGFCPYDVMYFDEESMAAFSCVACGQCVKACPNDALAIVDVDEASTDVWKARF